MIKRLLADFLYILKSTSSKELRYLSVSAINSGMIPAHVVQVQTKSMIRLLRSISDKTTEWTFNYFSGQLIGINKLFFSFLKFCYKTKYIVARQEIIEKTSIS